MTIYSLRDKEIPPKTANSIPNILLKPPFWIYGNEMLQNILIHRFRLRTFFYIFDMVFSGITLVGPTTE